MASRSAPRGAAQRKLVTYSKGSRDRKEKNAGTTADSTQVASSLYDFPDSDDAPSSPPRSKATPAGSKTPRPQPLDKQTGTKKISPGRSPSKHAPEDSRKRKHANSEDGDAAARKPTAAPNPPRTSSASQPKLDRSTVLPTHGKIASRSTDKSDPTKLPEPATFSHSVPRSPTTRVDEKVTLKRSVTETPRNDVNATRPRKTRLIDRLAAQKAESSDSDLDPGSESDMDYDGNAVEGDSDIKAPSASQTALLTPRSKRAALVDREFWARPAHNQARMSASKKVRQTYSQMRSIRSDAQPEGDILALSGDPNNDPLLSSPSRPNPGSFAAPADEFDFDNSDEDQAVTIKSVHELRRAGANNRFADEMEDLLSRIGTPRQPASLRRNALLELAQKLQRQEFSLQFRDHSARDTIAKNIGDEEDIISGFAMAASLVVFLSSNNAPNLLQQLVEEKIGELLGRLLRVSEDVVSIAGQRKTNLSKTGRGTVAGVKAYLQRMNIWHGYEPRELSPRSIALQLHHILQRNLEVRLRSDMIKNLEDGFASIAEDQAQRVSPDASLTPLVVLIMEAERGAAITVLTSNQLHRRASNIALFLKNALAMWPDNRGDMQSATLKLAIDTTNAEVGAEAFSSQSLLAGIARAARLGLDEVQKATQRQAFDTSMYDGLLLILGIMINILEHSPRARTSMDSASMEQLADLFTQNRNLVAAADSEDKSKVSIAVGYLAVILGYLCLGNPGRQAITNQGTSVDALVDAIREFIEIHRSVDAKVHELEGLVQDLRMSSR